ncbi:MAG: AAA family ATPase [Trueperaceae bacterium]
MKRIELVSLRLGNFKGAKDFTLELAGDSAAVRGRNASGKTTLFDAFTWLLFEKDSHGRKDFDIKTLVNGKALSGVEHEVEGVLRVDGEEITLKRVYQEVWTKKRGAAVAEHTGHTTDHYVNGVPVTKGEYTSKVAGIADEATWRLLSDPGAFQALHWTDRRKVLLDVCGDVSDADVIASDPALADLPEILGEHTLDDARKITLKARAKVNQELAELPVRISEVQRNQPETPEQTRKQVEAGLAATRQDRQDASEALAAAKAGAGDVTAERKRLREVEDALSDLDRQATRAATEAQDAAQGKVLAAKRSLEDADERRARFEGQVKEFQADLESLEGRLEGLRGEWSTVAARKVEADIDGTCPACQQALPADQVEAAHRTATAELNAKKAKELARIKADAAELTKRKDAKAAELALTEGKIESLTRSREGLVAGLAKAEEEAAQTATTKPKKDPTQGPEYARLAKERDELTERIERLSSGDAAEIERLTAELGRLDDLVSAFERDLAAYQQRQAGEARIEELKGQEQELAAKFEELEHHLFLMDEFTRRKVSMLEERVAEHFQVVSFRLFKPLINGGIEEACDTTVNGVPYESVNHAGQIAAGLDIIRTLQRHHGLSAPVWVDQAESIHDIPETGAQQIALVVSPSDKQLRVELQEAAEVAA